MLRATIFFRFLIFLAGDLPGFCQGMPGGYPSSYGPSMAVPGATLPIEVLKDGKPYEGTDIRMGGGHHRGAPRSAQD